MRSTCETGSANRPYKLVAVHSRTGGRICRGASGSARGGAGRRGEGDVGRRRSATLGRAPPAVPSPCRCERALWATRPRDAPLPSAPDCPAPAPRHRRGEPRAVREPPLQVGLPFIAEREGAPVGALREAPGVGRVAGGRGMWGVGAAPRPVVRRPPSRRRAGVDARCGQPGPGTPPSPSAPDFPAPRPSASQGEPRAVREPPLQVGCRS